MPFCLHSPAVALLGKRVRSRLRDDGRTQASAPRPQCVPDRLGIALSSPNWFCPVSDDRHRLRGQEGVSGQASRHGALAEERMPEYDTVQFHNVQQGFYMG